MSLRTILLFAILLLTVVLGEQRLRSHKLSKAQFEAKCHQAKGVTCPSGTTITCCKPGKCFLGFVSNVCEPGNRIF